MNHATLSHMTSCGLPGVDSIPFGTHACHFYKDKDALIAALVPYFVAGLRANERCLWITALPLPADEALQVLRAAWPETDHAIQSGKLRILDFDEWYESAGQLKGLDIVQLWLDEEERALSEGCTGLRITGNVTFVTPGTWASFMDYEQSVSAQFRHRRIIALCSYLVTQCDETQLSEVMHVHNCALERDDENWRVTPRPDYSVKMSYRCYLTNENDRIQSFEIIEGLNDAEVVLKAQELVASTRYASAEVWQGKRLIGKWINRDIRRR
jgi:hypothetical protein